MLSVPKPPKSTKKSVSGPNLTEDDYIEIGERLSEALEYGSEVTITTYGSRNYEKFTGVIKAADVKTKMLTMDIGELDDIKISANTVIGVQ